MMQSKQSVQSMLHAWWIEFKKDTTSFYLTLIAVVAVVGFGGLKAYRWHTASKEQAAQLVVAEAVEEYYKASDAFLLDAENQQVVEQRIDDARIAFDGVLSRHKGSKLIPYVQALDADVLWHAGSKDKALAAMQKAIDGVSMPAIKNSFRTKYALMLLDTDQAQKGLDMLTALSQDSENSVADYAIYNLGYHYWIKGDVETARATWKKLESFTSKDRPEGASPYLDAAQKKLQVIVEF
jgi:hypothetical protein